MINAILRRLLPAATIALAVLSSAPAGTSPYSSLIVFGDSLSDNGNNGLPQRLFDPTQTITGNSYIPSNTYASRVYSNGPVSASATSLRRSVCRSCRRLPAGPTSRSASATTGTASTGPSSFPYSLLIAQSGIYLGATSNTASASTLYVITSSSNDARAALAAISSGADVATTIAATAALFAANVGAIHQLAELAGAQHIVVWDAPNLGLAPQIITSRAANLATFLARVDERRAHSTCA